MDGLCTLSGVFEPVELPSYDRRSTERTQSGELVTLLSDALKPSKIEILTLPSTYRLTQDDHDSLRAALMRSVKIRQVMRRT
jgi:hypothetical protein